MFDDLMDWFSGGLDWLKSNSGVSLLNNTSTALNFYNQYKAYNELQRVNLINSKQIDLAKQSLYSSLVSKLGVSNLRYSELTSKVNAKERQAVGSDAFYAGSHGIEIYGSAVQDMFHNINAMEQTKTDLYYTNILNRNTLVSATENKATQYSLLQHEYNTKARNYRKFGTLDIFSSMLGELLK